MTLETNPSLAEVTQKIIKKIADLQGTMSEESSMDGSRSAVEFAKICAEKDLYDLTAQLTALLNAASTLEQLRASFKEAACARRIATVASLLDITCAKRLIGNQLFLFAYSVLFPSPAYDAAHAWEVLFGDVKEWHTVEVDECEEELPFDIRQYCKMERREQENVIFDLDYKLKVKVMTQAPNRDFNQYVVAGSVALDVKPLLVHLHVQKVYKWLNQNYGIHVKYLLFEPGSLVSQFACYHDNRSITAYEALRELQAALRLGGEYVKGKSDGYATAEASLGIAAFFVWFNQLPVATQTKLEGLAGDKKLGDVLSTIKSNREMCVEIAANWIESIISIHRVYLRTISEVRLKPEEKTKLREQITTAAEDVIDIDKVLKISHSYIPEFLINAVLATIQRPTVDFIAELLLGSPSFPVFSAVLVNEIILKRLSSMDQLSRSYLLLRLTANQERLSWFCQYFLIKKQTLVFYVEVMEFLSLEQQKEMLKQLPLRGVLQGASEEAQRASRAAAALMKEVLSAQEIVSLLSEDFFDEFFGLSFDRHSVVLLLNEELTDQRVRVEVMNAFFKSFLKKFCDNLFSAQALSAEDEIFLKALLSSLQSGDDFLTIVESRDLFVSWRQLFKTIKSGGNVTPEQISVLPNAVRHTLALQQIRVHLDNNQITSVVKVLPDKQLLDFCTSSFSKNPTEIFLILVDRKWINLPRYHGRDILRIFLTEVLPWIESQEMAKQQRMLRRLEQYIARVDVSNLYLFSISTLIFGLILAPLITFGVIAYNDFNSRHRKDMSPSLLAEEIIKIILQFLTMMIVLKIGSFATNRLVIAPLDYYRSLHPELIQFKEKLRVQLLKANQALPSQNRLAMYLAGPLGFFHQKKDYERLLDTNQTGLELDSPQSKRSLLARTRH